MKHFSLDHLTALSLFYYALGKKNDAVYTNYVYIIMFERVCGSDFPANVSKRELLNVFFIIEKRGLEIFDVSFGSSQVGMRGGPSVGLGPPGREERVEDPGPI